MGLCSLTCFRINLVFLFLFRGSQTKKTCRKCTHVYCVVKSCGRVLFPKTNDRLCCRLVTLDHLSKVPVYTNKTGATNHYVRNQENMNENLTFKLSTAFRFCILTGIFLPGSLFWQETSSKDVDVSWASSPYSSYEAESSQSLWSF